MDQQELDYQTYKSLLDLWSKENPIKTAKLQVLLAVNAVLVAALNLSGGITADKWYLYLAGTIFCFIWTFSIGRTSLFQDVWQIKLNELRDRYPSDPRFSILDTTQQKKRARLLLRIFGAIPSKWYLLFTPFGFALAWLVILVISLR
jgi:hypothetical protein